MRHWTTKHIEEIGGGSGLDLFNLSERIMLPEFEETEIAEKHPFDYYFNYAIYRSFLKNTIDGTALVSLEMTSCDVLENHDREYRSGIGIYDGKMLHYCYNLPHNWNYEPAEQKASLILPIFKGCRLFIETSCAGRMTEEEVEAQRSTVAPNTGRIMKIEKVRVYK